VTANQTDIAALFGRDPLDKPYTREELTAVIQHYREARQRFALGSPKPVRESKTKAISIAKLEGIDL
jgi:hypothetical protein